MAGELKKELEGVQSLVAQLQQQAGDGEIDAALIEKIGDAVNVAVDQAGNVHDKVAGEAASQGANPAPPPPDIPKPEDKDDDDANKILATRPPRPEFTMPGNAIDELSHQMPEFIKALEAGSIKKAQEITGHSQQAFDEMFNKACKVVLTEGGFTYKNITKMHFGAPTMEALEGKLAKGMVASDIPGVYLMKLAKLMMPVYAGLRRRLSTQTPDTGSDKATWKTQIGFQNLNFATLMSVAEAAIGQEVNESFLTFETAFRDTSLNDKVSLKAVAASRGYDDPLQVAVIRIMAAILQGEERKILGDNYAALANPSTVTGTPAGSGSLGNATDKFIVTALTYRGWLAGSTGGASAVGETAGTASANVNLSAAASVTVTWTPVVNAVAYNVYYNPASHATNKYLIGTYKVPTTGALTSLPSSGNAPPTDCSANSYGYEGLISWCQLSTIYGQVIPGKVTPTDNAGATLSTGTSGVTQIDAKLASLWKTWQIAPTLMVMSPDMVGALTDKLLGLNSGNMYRIEISQERGTMAGGAFISGYVNKYAPYADGTPRYIDTIPHPYMPDGTILFLCETIPYPMARESRGFALDTLIPYTYFPLAASTIAYPFAVTVSEVVECFHPAAQTALTGVALS